MTVLTNASNAALAADLADSKKGTFTGLIIRKKGVERGSKNNKVRYGDDQVHAVIITGFKYMSLVKRSLSKLDGLTDSDLNSLVARGYKGWSGRGAKATEIAVTRADFDAARIALEESFNKTLAGTNTSTTDHVYDPLTVDGDTVRGCRVYVGNPNGEDAEVPGTIYLQGLQIGSKVLDPASNGPKPASKSKPEVVAKNVLRSMLPVSRYVSYALAPKGEWALNVGAGAAAAADADGITLNEDRVNSVKAALAAK